MKNILSSFLFSLVLTITLSCSDTNVKSGGLVKNFEEKSLLGSECDVGCIWSSYAVSSGVQRLTHYCDGTGCHCVVIGDIYTSCYENSYYEEEIIETETVVTTTTTHTETVIVSSSYNFNKGSDIAAAAYYEASSRNTTGWCYNAVADAVESVVGVFLWGSHAYQAADQFAQSSHFYEVFNYDIYNLPAGAVVVWGRGSSRSGHISVSLGDGREASDHIANQMTYHYGGAPARVFYPK